MVGRQMFGYVAPSANELSDLNVGAMQLRHIDWLADAGTPPEVAADRLVRDIGMWLGRIGDSSVAMVS
jgi:hypothetical protein